MEPSGEGARPRVPVALLGRFADATGRLMAERRDRSRRATLTPAEAAARTGTWRPGPSPAAAALAEALERVDAGADDAIGRLLAGRFPPAGPDRARLAMFVALRLVLGRGYRAELARTAEALGEAITGGLGELLEALGEETPEARETPGPLPDRPADVILEEGGRSVPLALDALPQLARLLAGRTWQLVRFTAPLVLTGDTPAVSWSRPDAGRPHPFSSTVSLARAADEVRVPLDPRHALILARRAPAGEVVRDLEERHARALNRTVAEATRTWMFYHPGGDPLEAVELERA
jgi:hypothetical protein